MNDEQMEAGRELDALVAEKVLGCKVYTHKRHDGVVIRYRCDCAKGTPELPPHSDDFIDHTIKPYSLDMRAAWEVVEKMRERGWWYTLTDERNRDGRHFVEFRRPKNNRAHQFLYAVDTAPSLAICLAALKTVEATATVGPADTTD